MILVEPFAGMAALSFATMGCQPPISWMGGKRGYTRVLMELLGLSRHNPPAAYIWGDVGPNVAALATLAGASGDARDVAKYLWMPVRSHQGGGGFCPAETQRKGVSVRGGPRGLISVSYASDTPAPQVESLPLPRASEVAAIIRGWKDEEPRALWTRLKAESWPSLLLPEGSPGRWLGPQVVEEVAGWFWCGAQAYKPGNVDSGIYTRTNGNQAISTAQVASDVAALPSRWPRVACWQGTATRLVEQLPERLDNVVAYLDPPYENTTGYKFGDCPRSEVLRMALDLSRRGATVAISEAVRLDRELGAGWTAVQIDGERRGQKRTFSKQQAEWLTLNRPPAMVPGVQVGMFGGAS